MGSWLKLVASSKILPRSLMLCDWGMGGTPMSSRQNPTWACGSATAHTWKKRTQDKMAKESRRLWNAGKVLGLDGLKDA